jgi:hypothetical protein
MDVPSRHRNLQVSTLDGTCHKSHLYHMFEANRSIHLHDYSIAGLVKTMRVRILLLSILTAASCSCSKTPNQHNGPGETNGAVGSLIADRSTHRGVCAVPIAPGNNWPETPEHLYQISGGIKTPTQAIPGVIDIHAQRRHGWSLFVGVTAPSNSSSADSLPVFHTWYTVEEAFDSSEGKVDCANRRPLIRLELPTQLLLATPNPARAALTKSGLGPSVRFDPDPGLFRNLAEKRVMFDHDGVVAFSHVAFNQEMYDFIRDNKYYSKDTLNSLINPAKSRVPIQDPPVRGVSLKLSWWPAAPDGLTPVPVWDNDPRFAGDAKNPPTTWNRVVVLDPTNNHTAPASVKLGGYDHPNPKVVGLDKFYSVKVTAEEADLANADFRIKRAATDVLGRPLQQGDYLLLTAMHIATREFDPWVFTTYWWHDTPDDGPFAADRPASVSGLWKNYVMDVSYNINNPKTQEGSVPVAYNPWLELFQLGGTRSQCMACHARAAFGKGVLASYNPKDPTTADPNGFEASPNGKNDPAFQAGTVALHRIWTIFTRAQ